VSGSGWFAWLEARFELARGGEAIANLRSMEGLRGVAVLLVFMVHYATLSLPWQVGGSAAWLATAHAIGHCGVDLFFVLSGFLIYGSLIERVQPFGAYLLRRVARIYPAFLAVLGVYLVLSLAMPSVSKLPAGLAASAWYVLQNLLLLPGMLPIAPIIEVAWSLSYEMFYYIVMPLVIAVAGLRGRSRGWRLGFFALLLALGLAAAATWGGPERLSLFLAGVLLYELLHLRLQWQPSSAWAVAAMALAVGVMVLPMPGPALQAARAAGLCLAFGLLCLVCFGRPQGPAAQALCVWPLRWLGNMSYSYYLVHGLALHGFFLVVRQVWPPAEAGDQAAVLMLLPALLCTLIVAAGLFLGVERPLSLNAGQARVRRPAAQPMLGR